MRIVGGQWKGRGLKGPAAGDRSIRPTSDRLRESLFNILTHSYDDAVAGARVIDLFAGTGALAIEALSRGARFALMVDDGAAARALIRANIDAVGLGGVTRLFRRNATRLGAAPPGEPFTLAFLDPPYSRGLVAPSLTALRDGGWLAVHALCIIEESADEMPALPSGFVILDTREQGDSQLIFARFDPERRGWS